MSRVARARARPPAEQVASKTSISGSQRARCGSRRRSDVRPSRRMDEAWSPASSTFSRLTLRPLTTTMKTSTWGTPVGTTTSEAAAECSPGARNPGLSKLAPGARSKALEKNAGKLAKE